MRRCARLGSCSSLPLVLAVPRAGVTSLRRPVATPAPPRRVAGTEPAEPVAPPTAEVVASAPPRRSTSCSAWAMRVR